MSKFSDRLEEAESLSDIFEIVKDVVRIILKKERSGLMLGLTEMGSGMKGFIGAFYPVGSNIIIMNRTPLRRIEETNPDLYKPYSFHILLHEYLHTLGILDEELTRFMTFEICRRVFGESHVVTQMSRDFSKFFPNVAYPVRGWEPENFQIELVDNFDRSNVRYIG